MDWPEIERLFFGALEVPEPERARWLEARASPEMAAEVRSLLRAHEDSGAYAFPRIGPYRLEKVISRGGMGEVWLAARADGQFEQKVALKLVRSGPVSEWLLPRFHQERQMLAQLNHPNIARLLDGGVSQAGQPYLAMEYVEGESIVDYCERRALPVRARLMLFQQLCSAVEYAHRNLIVHRDIKPANVLVTAEGVPKLLDFGIATLLKDNGEQQTRGLTQAGLRLLTPEYASPEQVRGLPVNTATDVYSLGALLYVLLSGKMPYSFASDSAGEMERVICEAQAPPPSEVAPPAVAKALAGDLDTILLKTLEKDPSRRYSSVEQFSADIQRHLDGLPIQARPQTLVYKAGRFIRRNRGAVAATVLVGLLLTGGLAAALWQAHIARTERLLAERRFDDVRGLAHSFLFDFNDAIQNLPGATPARHMIVDKALEYLNHLAAESGNDPRLQSELAEAYLRVGELQGGLGRSNLGDSEGAMRSFERALAISEEAVRRDPDSVEWRRYLARAHMVLGDVLSSRAGPAAAVAHYREALQVLAPVAPQLKKDVKGQFEMASIYEALGDFLGNPGLPNLGDSAGAKDAYERTLAINQSIAAAHPENARARRNIGLELMKIDDVELGRGDVEAALALERRAVSSLEAAGEHDPLDSTTALFLALAVGKLGRVLEADGQTGAARSAYQRASQLHRALMQADPRNEIMTNSYVLSLQMQADLLRSMGNSAAAMPLYGEALGIARRISAADPNNLRRRGLCGELLVAMGSIDAAGGRKQEAVLLYREGLPPLKALADRAGAPAEDIAGYAEALLGCPLKEFADPGEALVYARRAVEASHETKWTTLDLLARTLAATADSAGAVVAERKALALLTAPSPKRKELQARLAKLEVDVTR